MPSSELEAVTHSILFVYQLLVLRFYLYKDSAFKLAAISVSHRSPFSKSRCLSYNSSCTTDLSGLLGGKPKGMNRWGHWLKGRAQKFMESHVVRRKPFLLAIDLYESFEASFYRSRWVQMHDCTGRSVGCSLDPSLSQCRSEVHVQIGSSRLKASTYLVCFRDKFKVWALNNGIHRTCLLAEATVDTLGHVNVVPADQECKLSRFDSLQDSLHSSIVQGETSYHNSLLMSCHQGTSQSCP